MKKYSIILCLLTAIITIGCDNEDTTPPALSVIKAELNFNAKAQKGFIIVSEADCQVNVSENWCHATVKGDSIIIHVDDNTSLEGRTARVNISSPTGSQTVPVSQMGGYFRLDSEHLQTVSDSIANIHLDVATPFHYEVSASASWIQIQKGTNKVSINVEKNLTGAPRMAKTTLSCPEMNQDIIFTLYQYSVDDLMGEWTASYTDMYGKTKTCPVTLVRQKQDISVNGLPDELTLKAKVKGDNDFAFTLGDALGLYWGEYRIYQCGVDTEGAIHDAHDPINPETTKVNYNKLLTFDTDDSYSCTFVADSTFANHKSMNGLAVTAYDLNGVLAGPVEMFINFILKR